MSVRNGSPHTSTSSTTVSVTSQLTSQSCARRHGGGEGLRLRTALAMLRKGRDLETVARVTHLPLSTLAELCTTDHGTSGRTGESAGSAGLR